jgi:hypothetical protein
MRMSSLVGKWAARRVLLVGAGIALGTGGCLGDGDPGDDEPEVGSSAEALEIENECTAGHLSWANPADETKPCTGPWTYFRFPTVTNRDPVCPGPVGCTLHNQCTHSVPQPPQTPTTTYTLPHGGCGFVVGEGLVCRPNTPAANQMCTDFKNQRVAAVDAPADQQVTSASSSVTLLTPSNAQTHTFRCNVTINYVRIVTDRDPVCGCQTPLYPQCEHAVTSGGPSLRVVTPSLQTKQQVRVAHNDTPPGQLADAAITPICSTGEDVPSLLPKLDRLLTSFADPAIVAPGTPLADEFVRRAKQSYELLDNSQVADAGAPHQELLHLYEQFPEVEPICGRHKPEIEEECAGDWQLRLCTRLTSAHVKAVPGRGDLIRNLYEHCIEALRLLADDVESRECNPEGETVEASADTNRRLHDKLLLRFGTILDPAPTADNTARIADVLHLVDDWYRQAQRAFVVPERRRAELDLVANKFWQVAYGYKPGTEDTEWFSDSPYANIQLALEQADGQPPAVARQIVEDALQETDTRGLKLDRDVLTAAYGDIGGEPVIVGAPLLHITSDALDSLVQRLDALVQFHDVGCALANCAAFTTPTKLSRFWKVLAHLRAGPGSNPDLAAVLAATPGTMLGWKPAFQAVASAQDRLIDALTFEVEAETDGGLHLMSSMDKAHARTAAYEANGLFLSNVGDRLYTGVHANQRARVKDHLNSLNARLANVQTSVDTRLVQLVDGLARVRDGETALAHLEAAQGRIASELEDLRQRETGFRAVIARGAADSEASVFEELMAEWSSLEGSSDEEAYLRVGSSMNLFLTGENATFDTWQGTTIDEVAVQKIEVPAKRAISISTAGVWAPSCAVRDARVVDPADVVLGGPVPPSHEIDPVGVVTGPEGYSIGWTGSSYAAVNEHRSVTGRLAAGVKWENCAGTPGAAIIGSESKACVYIEASIALEKGKNWQSGVDGRTSAQFSSGLFLPTTPFEAAAGSLVVVEMPPGDTDRRHIRDIHLVRSPHTTIVVDEPADLWLAVNDFACGNQDSDNELHVKVATFVPFGEAAEALIQRMAHTLSVVRQRLPGLLERGEMLSSESTEIELEAKLGAIGGPGGLQIPVDDYPPPMRDLFFKYLAREMTRLEAAVRVRNIEREILIKEGEYRAAVIAVQNSAMSGYLVSLLPKWTVRSLRFKELRNVSSDYVRDVHGYLAPLLQVWYPDVLANVGSIPALQQLTTVDVDTPVLLMTSWLNELGNELAQRIENAEVPYPLPQDTAPTFVALRFVEPTQLDPACAGSPSARCPRLGHPATFRWATTAQSRALWEALGQPGDGQTRRQLVFQPSPDDLYQLLGGTHYLSCTRSLPVVRKVGLALTGFLSSQLPPELREAEGEIPVGSRMAFTDGTGAHYFELSNPSWLHLANVPLIYGTNDYNKVRTDFGALVQDVRGVSPFTTFVFDIPESTVAAWNLRGAKTIDLLLELEAIRSNDIVSVPVCSPGQ